MYASTQNATAKITHIILFLIILKIFSLPPLRAVFMAKASSANANFAKIDIIFCDACKVFTNVTSAVNMFTANAQNFASVAIMNRFAHSTYPACFIPFIHSVTGISFLPTVKSCDSI